MALIISLLSFQSLGNKNKVESKVEATDLIMGIDKNKNLIRDDVEDFIVKELNKTDPLVKKAYMNLAETYFNFLKYRFNKKKLQEYDQQKSKDLRCILSIDQTKDPAADARKLQRKIFDTPLRDDALYQAYMTLGKSVLNQYPKKNWPTLCR